MIVFIMCMTASVVNAKYSVEEFNIKNIDVPEGYISCSRTECDPELDEILKNNGFNTLNDWNTVFMNPAGIYVNACGADNLDDKMYLICKEEASPKTKEGIVHKLARDYNLAESAEEKDAIIKEINMAITQKDAAWVKPGSTTTYVEYNTVNTDNHIHAYKTIFNGNSIELQFWSKKPFTTMQKEMHYSILKSLEYNVTADYSELKKSINDFKQKKLEEESNTGKNTQILWYIIGILVAMIIAFSIFMAIRSRNKKRKKVIVLREYEVIDGEDDADLNN